MADMARWSNNIWGGTAPGADDIVVIPAGQTVVLDESTQVKGIIVDGGELLIEDGANLDIDLSTDYLLVVNGGLFQAGTETDLLDTNFTLTLEGDDPGFDLQVTSIVTGDIDRVVPSPAPKMGDVNCDDRVTTADALFVAQFTVGNRTDSSTCPLSDPRVQIYAATADVSGNGSVSVADALFIAQCSVGLPNDFCPAG